MSKAGVTKDKSPSRRKQQQQQQQKSTLPSFPRKTVTKLNASQTEKRREQLEAYMQAIAALSNCCRREGTISVDEQQVVALMEEFLEVPSHVNPSLPLASARDDPEAYDKERKNKLMDACSVASPTLVRIYFLDCTFKTVSFSETTTIRQLGAKISGSLGAALFEVRSDVRVASQLKLLGQHERFATVAQRWEQSGFSKAKLVVPLYRVCDNISRVKNSSAWDESVTDDGGYLGSRNESSAEGWVGSSLDEVDFLANELKELRQKHEDLRDKYETLRKIIKKKGRHNPNPHGSRRKRDDEESMVPSNTAEVKETILLCGWLEKLSDYTRVWRNRYFILWSNGNLSYYYSEPRASDHPVEPKVCMNLNDVARIVMSSREYAFTIVSDTVRVILHAPTKASFDEWLEAIKNLREKLASAPEARDLHKEGANENYEEEEEQDVIPATELILDTDEFNTKKNKKITASRFLECVATADEFFDQFDRNYLVQALSRADLSPHHLNQVQEIVSAMQILYTNVLEFGERWTKLFREWLLKSLKKHMLLPVQRPDLLMSVVQNLCYEHMLHAPETVKMIENAIELSLRGGGEEEETEKVDEGTEVEALLGVAKGMVDTLHIVVDDLVPMLPSDFNVLSLFQKAAERRISQKVAIFYSKNKVSTPPRLKHARLLMLEFV